jgi:hypothetical protein
MGGLIKINPKFAPLYLEDEKFIFLLTGGRAGAKSFNASTFIERLSFQAGHKILYSRYTMASASLSIIPEFKDKIEKDGFADKFNITKAEIQNTFSGSEILFRGIKTSSGNQTANLKSIQGLTTFVGDELEEWQSETDFDTLVLSIRQKGIKNRVILIMNPTNAQHFVYQKYIKDTHRIEFIDGIPVQISTHPDVLHIHTTYLDNLEHLSREFLAEVERVKATDKKKYAYKIIGAWQDKNEEDALWTDNRIGLYRVSNPPAMKRIVIAIDPAVTANDTSDETGIIAAGLGTDNHLYVLEDGTGRYTPAKWAEKAVQMFKRWKADRIIGETNNGGDLIEMAVRAVAPNVPYRGVHATRDKKTRAEPVAALYELARAHHVGIFPELEYEMTTWEGKKGEKSPNRIDALVWAAAELFPEITRRTGVDPSRVASMFG